jgi:hypothetical protein
MFNVRIVFAPLMHNWIASSRFERETNTTVVTIDERNIPEGHDVTTIINHEMGHAYADAKLRHENAVRRYNMAMDAIINDMIVNPAMAHIRAEAAQRDHDGKSWEEIFNGMRTNGQDIWHDTTAAEEAEQAPDDWYEADWGILDTTGYMTPDDKKGK